MLDIALIIPELQKYGGAERVLLECMVRWQHRHRLTLYSSRTSPDLLAETGVEKVTLRTLSSPFEDKHEVLLNSTLLPKIWESEIGHHDVYHGHLWPTHLIDRHPMIWYPHEPLRIVHDLLHSLGSSEDGSEIERFLHFYPKQRYDKVSQEYYEAALRTIHAFDTTGRPDRIVANSRYTARYLEAVYGRPVTDVVYPGVSIDTSPDLAASRPFVLSVGQLWRHKRVRLAIEAIHHIDDVDLYIVGSGPEEENLRTIADRTGVLDRVFFLSGLNNRDLGRLYKQCLCCIFVPVREPFGIVALETLAAGKPLIAVNEGGFTEIVDERCAFLVAPQPATIAACVKQLLSDPKLARKMGQHGRKFARQRSWGRTARELLDIIEDCHRTWHANQPHLALPSPAHAVGAHYFTWYREGYGNAHWNDTALHGAVSDSPCIGYYDSTDGDTIRYHLQLMQEAKLDFICFNLHVSDAGIDPFELRGASLAAEIARSMKLGLRLAVNLCFYTRAPQAIEQALSTIRKEFLQSDDALTFREKPVLFFFWTGAFDQDHDFIQKLETLSQGIVRIALSTRSFDVRTERRKTFHFFDGFSLFSPLEVGPSESWEALWQRHYDAGAAMRTHCRVLTISPGYDDRLLLDPMRAASPFREVPRHRGATYRRTIDFALRQKVLPDITLVATFNEFHENTNIEPGSGTGDAYIRITADYVRALKQRKPARMRKSRLR